MAKATTTTSKPAKAGWILTLAKLIPFKGDRAKVALFEAGQKMLVDKFEPATEADATRVAQAVRATKDLRRDATAYYKTWKDPLNAARQQVLDQEKATADVFEPVEQGLGRVYASWERRAKLERERALAAEQEQANARAIAERQAQVAALQAQAASHADPLVKQAIVSEAASLAEAPVIVEKVTVPEVRKPAGIGVVSTYHGEVVDFMALIKAVAAGQEPIDRLLPNEANIDDWARSTKGMETMPGVVVRFGTSVSGRRLS